MFIIKNHTIVNVISVFFIAIILSFTAKAFLINYNSKNTTFINKNCYHEVTFVNNNVNHIYGLSDADIIFEHINPNNSHETIYKAIYLSTIPSNVHPAINIEYKTLSNISSFTTVDKNKLYNNFNKSADKVFISFPNNNSSSFIYNNGLYTHYKNTALDIDKNNNEPITVSNIVVQFVDNTKYSSLNNTTGDGYGYMFCDGKGLKIRWYKKDSNPIKIIDENGNPVTFLNGHTWWFILDKSYKIKTSS